MVVAVPATRASRCPIVVVLLIAIVAVRADEASYKATASFESTTTRPREFSRGVGHRAGPGPGPGSGAGSVRSAKYSKTHTWPSPQAAGSRASPTSIPGNPTGFVQPEDFKPLPFSQQNSSPFFGIGGESGSAPFPVGLQGSAATLNHTGFPAGVSGAFSQQAFNTQPGFGGFFGASSAEVGFRPQDFIKTKRGANDKAQNSDNSFFTPSFFDSDKDSSAYEYTPVNNRPSASESQTNRFSPKPTSFDDDFSFANFEKEIEDDEDPRYRLEEGEDGDGEERPGRPAVSQSRRKEKNSRYPSYSSYYNTHPHNEEDKGASDDEGSKHSGYAYDSGDDSSGAGQLSDSPSDSNEEKYSYHERANINTHPSRNQPTSYSNFQSNTSPDSSRLSAHSSQKNKQFKPDPYFGAKSRYPSSGFSPPTASSQHSRTKVPNPNPSNYDNRGPAKFEVQDGFRPSPVDPGVIRASASIPSYDYDHSPSQQFKSATAPRVTNAPRPTNQKNAAIKPNCKKIEKQIGRVGSSRTSPRNRREEMSCYVCEDPKTGGSYEQCAYGSEPVSKAYYFGRSQAFTSDKDKPYSFRQRRYLSVGPSPDTSSSMPLSRKAREEPDDFFGSYTFDHGDKDDYRFGPEFFTQSDFDDRETSEASHSSPLKSASEKCKRVIKKEGICMVCDNPEMGGTYEQCSYTMEPQKSSFAFGRSSSYGSAKKPKQATYAERHRRNIASFDEGSKLTEDKFGREKKKKKSASLKKRNEEGHSDSYKERVDDGLESESSEHGENQPVRGGAGLDPYLYGSPEEFGPSDKVTKAETSASDETEDVREPNTKSYEDYFSFLFPEYIKNNLKKKSNKKVKASDESSEEESLVEKYDDDHFTAESKDEKTDFLIPDYFTDTEPKKDLEKMLGEFTQKDRSQCKKVLKDHMTCFQCVDKKGMQHEECMFVAASEPKESHLAYQETKIQTNPNKTDTSAVTQQTDASSTQSAVKVKPNSKPSKKTRGERKFSAEVTTEATLHPSISLNPVQSEKFRRQRGLNKPQTVTGASTRQVRRAVESDDDEKDSESIQDQEDHESHEEEQDKGEEVHEEGAPVKVTSGNEPSTTEFTLPEGPEGLYSEETRPVFDRVLKISLPKYMLTKSEHEAIFDEVLASGG